MLYLYIQQPRETPREPRVFLILYFLARALGGAPQRGIMMLYDPAGF